MLRVLNGLMALLFLFGAALQFNDTDPVRWAAIYAAAAVASVLAAVGRRPRILPLVVLLIAAGWAITLAPNVVGRVPFFAMFGDWEMRDTGVEELREMYGLLIIGAWMAVLTMLGLRRVRSH